jgi:hypothetical protein
MCGRQQIRRLAQLFYFFTNQAAKTSREVSPATQVASREQFAGQLISCRNLEKQHE